VPELPEVETMVRGVHPHIVGRRILQVVQCPCECRPITLSPGFDEFAKRMRGTHFTAARRLAKRAVLDLSTGDSIVIEPRMTGLLLLADPPDPGHLRLEWQLEGSGEYSKLWFWDRRGLGTVRLLRSDELAELGATKLGPDALAMTAEAWQAACRATPRAIKVLLLDQRVAAGIGNLYASEILHRSGISPLRAANELTRPRIARMQAAVIEVLEEAIACEGSTLGDATYRTALSINGTYQNRHRVYKKTDEACPTCGKGAIVRIVQAQRSTFYCPKCQK
jgi:formamidopyrimidine-DNA glycosylase